MMQYSLHIVNGVILMILCLSCAAFADTRQYMCVDGQKNVRAFCAEFMNYDFCNDCPPLQNNNDSEWCFCAGNASEIAVMNVGCLPRKKNLNTPVITSMHENNSVIVANPLETMFLMNISYQLDAMHYVSSSEHITIEMECTNGLSLFILEPSNVQANFCEKPYVYPYLPESDHMVLMGSTKHTDHIFAEEVSVSLIDSAGFYGDECTFTSRVERVTSVASDASNKFSVKLKPTAAPFNLFLLTNETKELLLNHSNKRENIYFTNIYFFANQVNEEVLYITFDPTRYSLLTVPMTNVMIYNLGLSNISDVIKENISTVHHFTKVVISFLNKNNGTVKESVLTTSNEAITSFSE